MRYTANTLHESIRARAVMLLGVGLISALDLERQAKKAHWNVRGPQFIALHELFDQLAEQAREWSDLFAERTVALGGVADGRIRAVADRSTLPDYPLSLVNALEHVEALTATLAGVRCADA